MVVSIIIPVYNEEKTIYSTLDKLSFYKGIEIVVVDGGSSDRTQELVGKFPVRILNTVKSRAYQLNEGVKQSRGSILLFLHADCFLEEKTLERIKDCLNNGYIGGCLSQRIDSDKPIYRLIEGSGNIRAKLFKIFYGDQAIFVRRDVFFDLGGFDRFELFDDVVFSKKLKKAGKVCVLNERIYASPRRWEKQGIAKTTFINWLLSLGFLLNIPTKTLKKIYYDIR